MPKDSPELLQGTLDLLVLKALQLGDLHGWVLCERIQQRSGDVLFINQGSLYPALNRLKRRGWISSSWRVTENNRRAKYYALTVRGRAQLAIERRNWERLSEAVNRLLETTS